MNKYPSFKMAGHPTPNDKLIVCPKCRKAEWGTHSVGRQYYCTCRGAPRMREATKQEYAEGRAALKTVVGKQA